MCDYSLMGIPNRLAKHGEELVLYRFPTNTKGFVSPADATCAGSSARSVGFWDAIKALFRAPNLACATAVCIPPGARLVLQNIPVEIQCSLNVNSSEEVIFTQLTSAADAHRDAVRFSNGREVLLQYLAEGQRAKVLTFELAGETVPIMWDELEPHSAR
jgi:hypothetical protein